MLNKTIFASLIALLAWSGFVQAQGALGLPIRRDEPYDPPTSAVLGVNGDGRASIAEIAATKIRLDETTSKSRQAAVRFLATADFNYYPEAEAGLIAALRADRVECVRFDAALALGNCRGLSLRMLEALNMTALGLELDGNPAESSERVRNAARASLSRCMTRGLCLPPLEGAMPMVDWADLQLQPTRVVPPIYAPVVPASLKSERERAGTISAPTPGTSTTKGSRPFFQMIRGLLSPKDAAPRDTSDSADPRLRGLTPLGSDEGLTMPTTPPNRGVPAPSFQYNYQQ